ncbi:hypothetical protein EOD39_18166 [Acipenser ruthenus]|uniref:Uncharacterized protein n=1 Tax=Acipenser ruthenus TaxID=7906 RepID=A0A444V1G2_ACIRT|nr:hypothetical protein EOD39_18166 [Acipenser ruthenus]
MEDLKVATQAQEKHRGRFRKGALAGRTVKSCTVNQGATVVSEARSMEGICWGEDDSAKKKMVSEEQLQIQRLAKELAWLREKAAAEPGERTPPSVPLQQW